MQIISLTRIRTNYSAILAINVEEETQKMAA